MTEQLVAHIMFHHDAHIMSLIGDEEVAEQLDDDQSDHHQTDLENQIQLHGL